VVPLSGECCTTETPGPDGSGPVRATREGKSVCLAIPGRIVDVVDHEKRLAKVDVAGVRRTINIGLHDEDGDGVGPGDWVLIHVGFALSRVDEEEAHATRRLLERMGPEYEQSSRS
jgi:hydrogenase expression/formation protein HypC